MTQFMQDFERFARERGFGLFRAVELCNGEECEVTFHPTSASLDCYSVAKAFVVTAVGMLYDEGKLDPAERPVDVLGGLCPEGTLPAFETLTVHDTLKHRIGHPRGYLDIDKEHPSTFGTDFLTHLLTTPPVVPPGTEEIYTDAAYYLLARVVEVRAGMPLETFLWERLFTPMGFREAAWSKCPEGHAMGATGLFIHTADMAKLGELYRLNGEYGGKRYLSREWVQIARGREYEFHPRVGGKGFGKGGANGQMLLVVPAAGRVVAWHSFDKQDFKPLVEFVCNYE